MKITFKRMLLFSLGLISFSSCNKKEKKEISTIYNEIAQDLDCLAKPSWFPHSQTPPPAEKKNSPFANNETVTNLDFHRWSWQKFLWLTKPTPTSKILHIKDNHGIIKPLTVLDTLPLFLTRKSMIPIDDAMNELTIPSGANVSLIYDQQACSNGVLTSNPSYNSTNSQAETLFYSLHTSPTMMNAANAFITKMKNHTIDVTNNTETFPIASLELKVSWIATTAIPTTKIKNYYTTTGAISTNGGETFTNIEVAMVGMHVVGVVENHPEFIWATFEHNDIAPNYTWNGAHSSASSTTEKLLFKKGSTTGIGGIQWDRTQNTTTTPYQAYDLFKYGIPQNADGSYMTTSQTEPTNFNNIKDINKCVADNLNDVWKNYFYNGSIWLDTEGYKTTNDQAQLIASMKYNISSVLPKGAPTTKPDSTALGLARGSLNCANVSMETFTQTFNSSLNTISVSNIANCFSCHSSPSFKDSNIISPLYLSHIFDAAVQNRVFNSTTEEIESMKNKQSLEHFINEL